MSTPVDPAGPEPPEDEGDGRMESRGLYEQKARAAAVRLDRAAALGRQMELFAVPASPEDPDEIPDEEDRRKGGRPKGARNKSKSKLRQLLAARGYRQPEDVLAEIAGLNSRDSVDELAMKRAERLLAWAGDGAIDAAQQTTAQRLAAAWAVLRNMEAAAAALVPYGLQKMSADEAPAAAPTFVVLPGGRQSPGEPGRMIDHEPSRRIAPPPLPGEVADQVAEPARKRGNEP